MKKSHFSISAILWPLWLFWPFSIFLKYTPSDFFLTQHTCQSWLKYDSCQFWLCFLAYYGHNFKNGEILAISGLFFACLTMKLFTFVPILFLYSFCVHKSVSYIKIWQINTILSQNGHKAAIKWPYMAIKWPFSNCTKVPLVGTLNLCQKMPDIMQKDLGQTDQPFWRKY